MDDRQGNEWTAAVGGQAAMDAHQEDGREMVLRLHEEQISVSKRVVDKNRVRVSTKTVEHEELIDELLAHEKVEIERTPVGQPILAMPAVREEGDTIVVPIVEEVLVVEKRLVLKEEVRIRRIRGTERHQERVTVRKQDAVVTRVPVENTVATGAAEMEPIKNEREFQ